MVSKAYNIQAQHPQAEFTVKKGKYPVLKRLNHQTMREAYHAE